MYSSAGGVSPDVEGEPIPPPDGGYGWVIVLAQFLINGFTWGVAASYGVYLSYYLSHNLFSDGTAHDFALIGGFNFAFALLIEPLATLLARLYDVRAPMLLGVIIFPIWYIYLSQGVCVGVAIGIIYIPSTAVLPQWFLKKRSFANGICAAGSGVGGLAISVIVFVVNLTATLLVRSGNREVNPDQQMFNTRLLRSYPVLLFLGWSFIMMFGYITLMFSLSDYALALGCSDQDAATITALLNLGAAVGRPAIGYLSDKNGRVEIAGTLTAICGLGAILGVFWAVVGPLSADIVGLRELPAFLSIVWLFVVALSASK
ncbi:hypothetical protein M426DRAFT_77107 [Hypoxylon sp. CI-4A]|nr:hypothetical protein M426DRAFT_77107 [Hypoxylon sp. CI-4A]